MKLVPTLALAALALGSSSCVVRIGDRGKDGDVTYLRATKAKKKSPVEVAFDNRKNLACLTAGMTVAEVLDVMEEGDWGSKLANPHRRESFPTMDGGQADILFFYTENRHSDGHVSEDELTPVYFENGQLVGLGPFAFESWRERVLGL